MSSNNIIPSIVQLKFGDSIELRTYLNNPRTGYIGCSITAFPELIQFLNSLESKTMLTPFDDWQVSGTDLGIVRFTKKYIKPENPNRIFRERNKDINPDSMDHINSRNRGIHEPKSYPRYLELSQPKEKDLDDSTY